MNLFFCRFCSEKYAPTRPIFFEGHHLEPGGAPGARGKDYKKLDRIKNPAAVQEDGELVGKVFDAQQRGVESPRSAPEGYEIADKNAPIFEGVIDKQSGRIMPEPWKLLLRRGKEQQQKKFDRLHFPNVYYNSFNGVIEEKLSEALMWKALVKGASQNEVETEFGDTVGQLNGEREKTNMDTDDLKFLHAHKFADFTVGLFYHTEHWYEWGNDEWNEKKVFQGFKRRPTPPGTLPPAMPADLEKEERLLALLQQGADEAVKHFTDPRESFGGLSKNYSAADLEFAKKRVIPIYLEFHAYRGIAQGRLMDQIRTEFMNDIALNVLPLCI